MYHTHVSFLSVALLGSSVCFRSLVRTSTYTNRLSHFFPSHIEVSIIVMPSKYPDMQKLVDLAVSGDDTRIVPLYAEIVELGFKHGLLYKRKCKTKNVGVHRKNRDGAMVCGKESMNIWDEVDRIGVCPDLFKDATAFEEPPDRVNEKAFLIRCAADKHLRKYKPGDIQISSIACSHWNQALGSAEEELEQIGKQ